MCHDASINPEVNSRVKRLFADLFQVQEAVGNAELQAIKLEKWLFLPFSPAGILDNGDAPLQNNGGNDESNDQIGQP